MTSPDKRRVGRFHWTEHDVGIAVLSFEIDPIPSPDTNAPKGSRPETRELTKAQRKVASLVVRGRTNAEIAAELGIAVRTVANHMAAILKKTGTASRFELARKVDG